MKENKYIGVTIGPIIKTLAMARKTRELWGASYIFSYIMKTLIQLLIKNGINKDDIIIPYAHDIDKEEYHYGAGLYPDRLILHARKNDFEKVKQTVDNVLSGLGEKIAGHMNGNLKDVQDYIKNYFQVYFLEKEVKGNEGPILELSPYLDTMEMQEKFIPTDENQYLAKFLDRVNGSFLFEDGFKQHKKSFDSLIEISSRELKKIDEARFKKIINKHYEREKKGEEDEAFIIKELKKIPEIKDKKLFKTCHKYIAIVQADGDNIKKTLAKIGSSKEKLGDFSRKLKTFAGDAARIIHEFGSTPVYIGGDDLLFFAPVVNQETVIDEKKVSSIFDLIDILDSNFKNLFDNASLSYGLSISYYKFPLNEALEQAMVLLKNHAKKYKDTIAGKEKNALAFKVLKHSGASFGTTFDKSSDVYNKFKNLLEVYGGEERHLNSLVHNLQLSQKIFKHIGKNEEKVRNFLNNSFDEEIHKGFETFFEKAAELIFSIYKEGQVDSEVKKFETVYSILRTLHFLKRKDNE